MSRFEIYLPPTLNRWIMREGETARITPAERDATVTCTDIADLPVMAERLSATVAAVSLNEHFTLVAEAVDSVGGIVDKFLGDGVLAFWLATDPADHAVQAARAALNFATAIQHENNRREASGDDRIRLRIGL